MNGTAAELGPAAGDREQDGPEICPRMRWFSP